jgi:hypothetical protein
MYLTIFDPVEEVAQGPLTIAPASMYRAFERVKDGRKRRGKPLVLTLIFLAKLAGELQQLRSCSGLILISP